MHDDWLIIKIPLREILRKFWKNSRLILIVSMGVIFLASITSVAAPLVFSRLIDQLPLQPEWLLLAFIAYALLLGLSATMQNAVQYMSLFTSQSLGFIAKISFFEKLLKKTTLFFVEHNPAQINNAQTSGWQSLAGVIQMATITFIPGITQILFSLIVLGALIDLQIVAIVLVYGISFIGVTYFANKYTKHYLDSAIKSSMDMAKFIGNSINLIEVLRQLGSDSWSIERFSSKAKQARDNFQSFARYRLLLAAFYGAALSIQFIITFMLLIPRYQAGELSLGDIVLFNILLLQLNQPFEMFGQAIDITVRAWSEFLPFARMWTAPEEIEPEDPTPFLLDEGRIEFIEVAYDYGNGRKLAAINFVVKPGQINFITGETGAGKSTLFALALKSLVPQSGKILIDNKNLNEISRASWFSNLGVVPQDVMLFNDSLKTNIVLGRPYDKEKLHEAARRASILEFIEALPDGFDSNVGERGLKLSGGERQRIAIARALYASPKILFLDEASAALDGATEKEIMDELRQQANEITILAITHRTSLISDSDRVYHLEKLSKA